VLSEESIGMAERANNGRSISMAASNNEGSDLLSQSLPDHIHDLISLQGSPRALHRKEAQSRAVFASEMWMMYTTYIWHEGIFIKSHMCCSGQHRVTS